MIQAAGRPAIQVENLTKRYGSVVALDGITFEVPAGTVLGLLGPNGAGKTTAVRILTTLIKPDSGRASVLGFDAVTQDHAVRACIGLAGQYAAIDNSLTAKENLRLIGSLTHVPKKEQDARSEHLIQQFDLLDAADRPARTYSGGMRRRLDLAAALVHRPPVLFLDEPTTGLDSAGRSGLWTVIRGLVAEGTTLLLTTQYLEEADQLADRIVVIDHGRVIAEGTPDALKLSAGGNVLEFTVRAAAAAATVLAAVSPTGDVTIVGDMVSVSVDEVGPAIARAVQLLAEHNIDILDVSVRRPTLDDVFLQLTGHAVVKENTR